MISEIAILANYNFHSEWMAFSSWYSIQKVMPDITVYVIINKTSSQSHYFRWTTKAGIKQLRSKILDTNVLTIPAGVMAIREFSDEREISDCTDEVDTPFVNIETCGNYNKKTWLEKAKFPPFSYVKKIKTPYTNLKERKVLKLWEQMDHIYSIMV